MKQRGRKSSAQLAVIDGSGSGLPKPPADYDDYQSELWSRIVAEKPAEWWDSATMPLLDELVIVCVEINRIARLVQDFDIKSDDDVAAYKKLHDIFEKLSGQRKRLMSSMRLTHQSRYNAQSAATADKRGGGKRPWDE